MSLTRPARRPTGSRGGSGKRGSTGAMRIVVLGAGALGGLIGARLSEAGQDVTLLEANVARARLLAEEGLFLSEADTGERHVQLKVVTSLEGLPPASPRSEARRGDKDGRSRRG